MSEKQTAPYGSWKSPITSDMIVDKGVKFGLVKADGQDVYWIEVRLDDGGRYVIVRRTPDGQVTDVNPAPYNARSRVHEYGGGSFTVHDGVVYFTHYADQRIYRQRPGEDPQPFSPDGKFRYADLYVDAGRGLLICVLEDHSAEGQEEINSLVALSLESGEVAVTLTSGNDFYAFPALSPDGQKLAWQTWNHPNMPWDGCELWVADLAEDGSVENPRQVAGGLEESIFQPQWSPDGVLYFVSDRSNWWNLYRLLGNDIEPVVEMEADFGFAQWLFGFSKYAFLSAGEIICSYSQGGVWHLAVIDLTTGQLKKIDAPYTFYQYLTAAAGKMVCETGRASTANAVQLYDPKSGKWQQLNSAGKPKVEPEYLSMPEAVEFPTENGLTAHGLYYPPANKDYQGSEDEKPPLMVISHGGPTSQAKSYLQLDVIQYWASRGFAVLDVNYGGSTGYGREFRTRLNGEWGVVDLKDCENGARYLAEQGLADAERLIIRGGSAGGYTTLCALAFGNTFKAGASYYGVSDLEQFVEITHKFESRYMDSLIGPYPEKKDVYKARSPMEHARQISCPVIFFQGLEDKIVPPVQSEMMYQAVRANELPTAYIPFEGEQHGFRIAENIKRALDGELYFYSKVLDFEIADQVESFEIDNL